MSLLMQREFSMPDYAIDYTRETPPPPQECNSCYSTYIVYSYAEGKSEGKGEQRMFTYVTRMLKIWNSQLQTIVFGALFVTLN